MVLWYLSVCQCRHAYRAYSHEDSTHTPWEQREMPVRDDEEGVAMRTTEGNDDEGRVIDEKRVSVNE